VSPVGVHLAGEGPNELGTHARRPSYRDADPLPGVLEALLRRIQPEGWQVTGGTVWKHIRKFRARGPTPNEELNVLGVVEQASRTTARVVAFSRDSDGDAGRVADVENGIERAKGLFPDVEVIGGCATPLLEAWILALGGTTKTESMSKTRAQSTLGERGVADKDTGAMVDVVLQASLDRLPQDAKSLNQWLARARDVLPRVVASSVR
jgi:hypothetical protein